MGIIQQPALPGCESLIVPPNPLALVAEAVSRGMSPEVIKQLMDLAERAQANDARNAFNRAFANFKAESVKIVKNCTYKDGPLAGKKWANLFAAVDAIVPALSKHGLSHSWRLTKDEPQWLEVTCTLRHELGHFETVSMGGPPDTGGAKSPIQARASSKSYLERYTLLAITGMASTEDDNDGVVTGTTLDISEALEYIANSRNTAELMKFYLPAYQQAQAAKDKSAMQQLLSAKARRQADLS
jgi:hypothetical protein